MTATHRGKGQMRVELPESTPLTSELPPVSALFLIYFDIRAGYTIGWKRSLPGIELEGWVEYNSLPSGLHTVNEDLIYFVHDRYAGLSAFVSAPASEESRNARMIAVGILVPLSHGRLGKSWEHADNLKIMAKKLVLAPDETKILEAYWESHGVDDEGKTNKSDIFLESPSSKRYQPTKELGSANGHSRARSASDGTVLLRPGNNLSSHHPVWSLSALLDLFGPLIFPVYRAALLRRRILISTHAPVHQTCDFVYDISILSNIPFVVTNLLASISPPQRLRPLFCIGVHDIPFLQDNLKAFTSQPVILNEDEDDGDSEDAGRGWIACTTDDILTTKNDLYDVLITLPPSCSTNAKEKVWPKFKSSNGIEIKATQRDLRRYRALRWGLSRAVTESNSPTLLRSSTTNTANGDMSEPTLVSDGPLLDASDTDHIVEPLSWSALAYSGFMWWASAGERRLASTDESEHDNILLDGLGDQHPSDPLTPRSAHSRSQSSISQMLSSQQGGAGEQSAKREMAIIAYFHRLTTNILTTMSDIIESTTEEDDEDDGEDTALHDGDDDDEGGPTILVNSTHIAAMGLDEWSPNDQAFIVELAEAYFGRRAQIEGSSFDICGIRIC